MASSPDSSTFPRPPKVQDRRVFQLDLTDHVEGVWDAHIPIVQQCTLEGVGIEFDLLDDSERLLAAMESLSGAMNLTIQERHHHRFAPQGLTAVFLLSDSHLAVHSWPEKRYIHVDLVTCTTRDISIELLVHVFGQEFGPTHIRAHKTRY